MHITVCIQKKTTEVALVYTGKRMGKGRKKKRQSWTKRTKMWDVREMFYLKCLSNWPLGPTEFPFKNK